MPLPPGPRGGIEDYAYGVVRGLTGRADVVVVAPKAPEDPMAGIDGADCRTVPARPLFHRRWPRRDPALRILGEAIRGADIIHVHMPAPRLERWAAELASRSGIPLVATYHMDALYASGRRDARSGLAGRALEFAYDRTSARPGLERATVIVTNAAGYARASRLLPRYLEKVRVVAQGIDPTHVGSADASRVTREKLLGGPGHLLLYLGRLVPYKGLAYLLEAVGRLDRKDVLLAIAGSGPLRTQLERDSARLGLTDRIRFLGFVPDAEVGRLLAAADLVACPSVSLAESTPIVLLEALACGTPVVGTRIGGTEESIPSDGVRGLLVPPQDAGALRVAIDRLLQGSPWSPARRTTQVRTWRDVATDYLSIFEELVTARPRAPGAG